MEQNEKQQQIKLLELGADPKNVIKHPRESYYYVPVSYIEADLDRIFGVLNWQTKNSNLTSLGNVGKSSSGQDMIAVAYEIELQVWHPILKQWISRTGSASTFASRNVIKTVVASISALALKNAAKSLGNVFGRNLNRDEIETGLFFEQVVDAFKDQLIDAKTIEDLKSIEANTKRSLRRSPEFQKLFQHRFKQIESKLIENKKEDAKTIDN